VVNAEIRFNGGQQRPMTMRERKLKKKIVVNIISAGRQA